MILGKNEATRSQSKSADKFVSIFTADTESTIVLRGQHLQIWLQWREIWHDTQKYTPIQYIDRDGEGRGVSLEWAEEAMLSEPGEEGVWGEEGKGGHGAFTEGALSGWRSPPLPRLSGQTQTAPEERKR